MVTIVEVRGMAVGGDTAEELRVAVTDVKDCPQLKFEASCLDEPVVVDTETDNELDDPPPWEFVLPGADCACDEPIELTATCVETGETDKLPIDALDCTDPRACPTAEIVWEDLGCTGPDHEVALTVTVTVPPDIWTTAILHTGGTPGVVVLNGSSPIQGGDGGATHVQELTVVYDVDPDGDPAVFEPYAVLSGPPECDGGTTNVSDPVEVGPLEPCPPVEPDCPDAQIVEVVPHDDEDDDCLDGLRRVDLVCSVTVPPDVFTYATLQPEGGVVEDGSLNDGMAILGGDEGNTHTETVEVWYAPGTETSPNVYLPYVSTAGPPACDDENEGPPVQVGPLAPCPPQTCPPLIVDDPDGQTGAPSPQVTDLGCEDVDRDGNRERRFEVRWRLTPGTVVESYYWQWGDEPSDEGIEEFPGPVDGELSAVHAYDAPGPSPETYQVVLAVEDADGCEDVATVEVTVEGCDSTCPTVTSVSVEPGDCSDDGQRRTVALDAAVADVDVGAGVEEYVWSFGDGSSRTVPASDPDAPATSHDYEAPGAYGGTLTVVGPDDCATQHAFRVAVDQCECPEIVDIDVVPVECVDETGMQRVELVADVTGDGSFDYVWDPGDGSGALSGNPAPHTYLAADDDAEYTVTLTIPAREGCLETSLSREFAPATCPTPDPLRFALCSVFKIVLLIGLGLLAVGVAILLCPTIGKPIIPTDVAVAIGLGLVVVGVLLALFGLAVWLFFGCATRGCDWTELGWQVAFVVGMLFIYAGFCPACPWFLVGLTVLVVAGALFVEWRRRCSPTPCDVHVALLWALVALDVTGLVQAVLEFCVVTSSPIPAFLWWLVVTGLNVYALWYVESNCLS